VTFAQIGEDFVHYTIQLVSGLGFGNSRLPGEALRDLRLLHSASMLTGKEYFSSASLTSRSAAAGQGLAWQSVRKVRKNASIRY
jgi:hypothetical protein